tara:strand:- start:164 stop:358 length:195 start_codon:yes stop_codon:yes gene_type:complete
MNISKTIGKYSYHIHKAIKTVKVPNVKKAVSSTKEQVVAGYTEAMAQDTMDMKKQMVFNFRGGK